MVSRNKESYEDSILKVIINVLPEIKIPMEIKISKEINIPPKIP